MQGKADPIGVTVTTQPVVTGHRADDPACTWRQQRLVMGKGAVGTITKTHQRLIGVLVPIACEEMIMEQVEQNARIAAKPRSEACAAVHHHRVSVDKTVDPTMLCDRGEHPWRITAGRKRTLDEIPEQAAHQRLCGTGRQVEMGEEIHRSHVCLVRPV